MCREHVPAGGKSNADPLLEGEGSDIHPCCARADVRHRWLGSCPHPSASFLLFLPFSHSLPVGRVFCFPPCPSAPVMGLPTLPHTQAEEFPPRLCGRIPRHPSACAPEQPGAHRETVPFTLGTVGCVSASRRLDGGLNRCSREKERYNGVKYRTTPSSGCMAPRTSCARSVGYRPHRFCNWSQLQYKLEPETDIILNHWLFKNQCQPKLVTFPV